MISRRGFLAGVTAALAFPRGGEVPSLKDACKDMFLIGTALDFRTPNEFNAGELDLI